VLPFRRTRFVPSALVFGAFAPDIAYFLFLEPHGGFGHTLPGAFLFSLPAALVALWLFHRYVKTPLVLLLPESFQRRLTPYLGRFEFLPGPRFALIALSALIGIATHILWDSFTHPDTWIYYHWSFLSRFTFVPPLGMVQNCRILQHVSTVVGLAILWIWCDRWFKSTKPIHEPCDRRLTPAGKFTLLVIVPAVALVLGIVRAIIGARIAWFPHSPQRIIADAVITMIAFSWWQVILCGLLIKRPFFSKSLVCTNAG
jgi:membrane-bound metal-dependent hydrolase YbcI (DUF457 family)